MPDVVMPRLSDTMEEGVLSRWLKAEGEQVHRGDVLAEIETDKATMDLEAYDDGVLERLLVPEGTTAPIGAPLAVIASGTASRAEPAGPSVTAPTESPVEPETTQPAPPPALSPVPTPQGPAAPAAAAPSTGRVRTSPLARRIAHDHGVDLDTVTGTGPGGRVVRADVEAAIGAAGTPQVGGPPAPPAAATPVTDADVEEVPLSAVRRITAQRLTESATAPHFYLTSVVDAGRLLAFRAEVNERVAATGTKISVTDLLVRACAVTLRAHPQVNSSWGGDRLLRHRRIHVGVAVAVEDGLIVPVIRDADRKSLGEIAADAHTLAERARAGRLTPDEFRGGTFTISNLGMYGVDHFTAVINPPEAAILAVGAATEEPVLREGQLAGRTTMKLTLSIDHRVLDGATAAIFLRDLKDNLEEPLRVVI